MLTNIFNLYVIYVHLFTSDRFDMKVEKNAFKVGAPKVLRGEWNGYANDEYLRNKWTDSDNNLLSTSTLPQNAPTDRRMQSVQNLQ